MSSRQDKKMRKLVVQGALKIQYQMNAQMEERFSGLFKPRPKWMPAWVHRKMLSLFVNQS